MSELLTYTALLPPDRVAPAGAAFDGDHFYTVNGMDPYVSVFGRDGLFIKRCRTVRPYRSVRFDMQTRAFCCVGSGCTSRIYAANGRFEETGSVVPERPCANGESYVSDAFFSDEGELINAAHRAALDVYSQTGEYLMTAGRACGGSEYILWARENGGRATYIEQNGNRFIETGTETYVLPDCVKLVSFIPYDGELYGAFTRGYIYTFVAPISYAAGFGRSCAAGRVKTACRDAIKAKI